MAGTTSTRPTRCWLLRSRRRSGGNPLSPSATRRRMEPSSSPQARAGCGGCFGRRPPRVKSTAARSVRFSKSISGGQTEPHTPKVLRKRSRGVRVSGDASRSRSILRRSTSRKSFFSAVSTVSRLNVSDTLICNDSQSTEDTEIALCSCGFPAHTTYDPTMPLVTSEDVEAGSFEELRIHADSMLGCWMTIMDRSESLDAQMVHVGVGKMKRMVMNRLAIPFTVVLADEGRLMRAWITTPVGDKITTASLVGEETEDKDGDLGDWTAKTYMTDYSFKDFCNGRSFRAMQVLRLNPKLGTARETRAVLPDKAEGKVLLYNITIDPPNNGKQICVSRLFRFTGPYTK